MSRRARDILYVFCERRDWGAQGRTNDEVIMSAEARRREQQSGDGLSFFFFFTSFLCVWGQVANDYHQSSIFVGF